MSRPNPLVLLVLIVATAGIMAWLGASRGVLLISAHEGDVYHFLDILFRMDRGLEPHADFVTPLGISGFLPIVWLMGQGFGAGQAFLYSQIAVAVALALPLWYVAWSRLPRYTGYAFAVFTVLLTLALTYGGTAPGLSTSMYYNRWAWAVAYLVLVIALVPGRSVPLIDGLILGVGLSALVTLKATFFVALLPGVVVALVLRGEVLSLAVTVVTGAVVAVAITVFLGFDYWTGYAGDLLAVARSEVRPYPGVTLTGLLGQAETIGALIVALLTYFWVSRAGHQASALALVLLVPGVFYITYQNFGNDPKWLVPFAAVLMALRPSPETEYDGPGLRTAMMCTALAAAVIFLPSAWTLALSPARHFAQDINRYEPILPSGAEGILIRSDRARTMTAQINMDVEGSVWSKHRDAAGRSEPAVLASVTFAHCEFLAGTLAIYEEISADLARFQTTRPKQVFTADLPSAYWLFGVGEPLQKGAPWYYGSLSGIENAEFVLVPKCSFVETIRLAALNDLAEADLNLSVVDETETYVLFAINRP